MFGAFAAPAGAVARQQAVRNGGSLPKLSNGSGLLKIDFDKAGAYLSDAAVHTAGFNRIGIGEGRYVHDKSASDVFAKQFPAATITDHSGRIFRLVQDRIGPSHFGAYGDGLRDDWPAWDECCRYARQFGIKTIFLNGSSLYGSKTFELPVGINIESSGAVFYPLDNFEGDCVVSTPDGEIYNDVMIDSLSVDVLGKRSVSGQPISGVIFKWISYIRVGRVIVENSTGNGLQILKGKTGAPEGSTHQLYLEYASIKADKNADPEATGVTIDGSDHFFGYGVVFGFSVGGSSVGSNNALGTWHVWSRYRAGWRQMRLGWDAVGEGNRGTIEVDSPGMVVPTEKPSLENGPVGIHVHGNAIRNRLDVIVNVSRWGDPGIRPPPMSITPAMVEVKNSIIDVDVVDYLGRIAGVTTIKE